MLRSTGTCLAALAALTALVLTGCGDDDGGSEESAPDSSESSSEPTPADGECAFLTADAVSEAVGTRMEITTAGPQTCFFGQTEESGELRVTVNEVPLQIDADTYAEASRDQCEGDITDVEVPDAVDAFACVAFTTQGFVFVEGDSVVIDVEGAADDATALAAAAAMLPDVTLG